MVTLPPAAGSLAAGAWLGLPPSPGAHALITSASSAAPRASVRFFRIGSSLWWELRGRCATGRRGSLPAGTRRLHVMNTAKGTNRISARLEAGGTRHLGDLAKRLGGAT